MWKVLQKQTCKGTRRIFQLLHSTWTHHNFPSAYWTTWCTRLPLGFSKGNTGQSFSAKPLKQQPQPELRKTADLSAHISNHPKVRQIESSQIHTRFASNSCVATGKVQNKKKEAQSCWEKTMCERPSSVHVRAALDRLCESTHSPAAMIQQLSLHLSASGQLPWTLYCLLCIETKCDLHCVQTQRVKNVTL